MVELSVVIPAYNEVGNIEPLYLKLKKVLDNTTKEYEIIFVDDGSTDGTFDVVEKLHKKDKKVRGIKFQRNFQKAAALSAGFSEAKGDVIITLDADQQDDPGEIPKFLEKLKQGYDLVVGWRYKRKDRITKKISSKVFNFLVRKFTNIKLHDSDCNFKAIQKKVIKDLNLYGGLYRYIPSLAASKGFKIDEVKVIHHKRKYGKSKYKHKRLLGGTLDLITTKFLLDYTKRPLHLFGMLGGLFTLVGFIAGVYLAVIKFLLGQSIGNRPLLLLAVLLIVLGMQFVSIGLIGEMIASRQQKQEKQYVIKREL